MAARTSPVSKKKQAAPVVSFANNTERKTLRLLCMIVGFLAFALYVNTLRHGYVLDDAAVITENRFVKGGLKSIPEILKTPYWKGYWDNANQGLYRPLSLVMFAAEWQLAPGNPFVGHFVNVLLYALSGCLLFLTLHKLFFENPRALLIAFASTVLFIAHPIHTEVVANIKSRDEILCFLFFILTLFYLLKFIKHRKNTLLATALCCFFLSLISKESAITFVLICPLTLWFFTKMPARKIAMLSVFFFLVAVAYIIARTAVLGGIAMDASQLSVIDNSLLAVTDKFSRMAMAIYILGRYLGLLVWPYALHWDYSYKEIPDLLWSDYRVWIAMAGYAALAGFAALGIVKKTTTAWAICFYLITISLVSNLVILIGSTMAERFLYMPSLGFCIAVAALLIKYVAGKEERYSDVKIFFSKHPLFFVLFSLILCVFAALTILRNADWRDNLTLYATGLSESKSARVHYNYGREVLKHFNDLPGNAKESPDAVQMLNESIRELKVAVQLYPEHADAYMNLGTAHVFLKKYKEAIAFYTLALRNNPNNANIYNNLGNLYGITGDLDKSINNYRRSIQLEPYNPGAYMNMGLASLQKGDAKGSIEMLTLYLQYEQRNATAYLLLSKAYTLLGDKVQAEHFLEAARRIDPALKN